jgi:hypothetical protein
MRSLRSSSRSSAILVALFVSAGAGALPAQAACPTNTIDVPGWSFQSAEPVYQSPVATDFGYQVYDGWDLVAGTVHVHHWGGLGNSIVRATDLYDVAGVPPGTNVTVTVQMDVGAWAATDGCGGTGCAGFVSGQIFIPGGSYYDYGVGPTFGGLVGFSFRVEGSLTLTAGAPVPVSYELLARRTAGGSHSANGVATIRFLGLPEGAVITSCQGYVDPSTPALPSSWGRLKARYR